LPEGMDRHMGLVARERAELAEERRKQAEAKKRKMEEFERNLRQQGYHNDQFASGLPTVPRAAPTAAAPVLRPKQPAEEITIPTKPQETVRYEWYQSSDTVTVDFLLRGVKRDEAEVAIKDESVSIFIRRARMGV